MTTYLLDDIAAYLVTQGIGVATSSASGYRVVKGFMPPNPDKVIGLFETGGAAPNRYPGDLDYPRFQVRVRGAAFGYSTARQKLWSVFTTLQAVDNTTTLNGWVYVSVEAVSDVIGFPLDSNNRPEVVMNFRALRSRTS